MTRLVVGPYYPYAANDLLPLVWEEQSPANLTGVNTFYYVNRIRRATALFDWVNGTKYAYLMSTAYAFNVLHDEVADLAEAARVKVSEITQRSVNNEGWCCSVGIEFPLVDPIFSGLRAASVVFAEGNLETSKLICCLNSVTELPFTPDGRSWYLYPNSEHAGTGVGSGGWFSA